MKPKKTPECVVCGKPAKHLPGKRCKWARCSKHRTYYLRTQCRVCEKTLYSNRKDTTAHAECHLQSRRDAAEKAKSNPEVYDRRQLEKYISQLSKRKSFFEVIGERIIDEIRKLPPLPLMELPEPSKHRLDEEEWVLLIGDVQTGSTVSSTGTGKLGCFNTKVLIEEIEYLKESLASIIRYHANRPRRIRILFMGDMIDGSTIFRGQLRAIDQPTVRQVVFVVEYFSAFLAWLSGLFEQVDAYGVVGNHGRIGWKGENDPMDNLDWLAYQWMKERVAANKRVTVTPSDTWFQIVDVCGWKFLMVHGDDIPPGTWGIPFYGALRGAQRWTNLLTTRRENKGKVVTELNFDFLVLADKHVEARFSNLFMNGNWVGGSEHSLKHMTMGGMPTQKLFAVHKTHGPTWQRDVKLRPPSQTKLTIYR